MFEILALLLVVLLAGALRMGWPGVSSFAFDEARLSLIALDMARGGQFARVGMPSSVGVPNLPAAAWIYSVPYLFSSDPLVATQFTALMSVGAVVATWALARRAWGTWAGLAAALFLAASPYAVLYSRSVWAQNWLPLLGIFWAWTAFAGAARHNRLAIGLHIFITGFAPQVHFAGAALVLPTAYFFLRFRWWRHLIPVLIGGGLALLALLPFVLEVACCRPDIAAQFSGAVGGESRFDLTSFAQLVPLALGQDWAYLLTGDLQPPDAGLWALIAGGLVGVGFIRVVWMAAAGARRAVSLPMRPDGAVLAEIVLAWLAASPLFFLRHSTPVWPHYHLAALPALALLVGAGAQAVGWSVPAIAGSQRAQRATILLPVLFVCFGAVLALGWAGELAQAFVLAGAVETPNGLGTPLAYSRAAAYGLPDDAPVLFFTHGDDPNVDGEAAVFAALWWGRDHRIVQGGSLLILPDAPAYLMATLRAIQAWEEVENGGLALDVRRFPRREGAEPFVATFYDGETAPAGFTLLDEPLRLQDGTLLEGWKARRVGPRLRISTLWRVLELPPPGIYQQFHHLRTAETLDSDQPFAISDVTISAPRWQVGDRLVVMGDFFVDDAGPFWVDVGHYTLPDGQRIAAADGGEGALRLGSFEIAANS